MTTTYSRATLEELFKLRATFLDKPVEYVEDIYVKHISLCAVKVYRDFTDEHLAELIQKGEMWDFDNWDDIVEWFEGIGLDDDITFIENIK